MKKELDINGAVVVAGDTKVVPKGSVDKIFINTTAVGEVIYGGIGSSNLRDGLSILVSRDIGSSRCYNILGRRGGVLSYYCSLEVRL